MDRSTGSNIEFKRDPASIRPIFLSQTYMSLSPKNADVFRDKFSLELEKFRISE